MIRIKAMCIYCIPASISLFPRVTLRQRKAVSFHCLFNVLFKRFSKVIINEPWNFSMADSSLNESTMTTGSYEEGPVMQNGFPCHDDIIRHIKVNKWNIFASFVRVIGDTVDISLRNLKINCKVINYFNCYRIVVQCLFFHSKRWWLCWNLRVVSSWY